MESTMLIDISNNGTPPMIGNTTLNPAATIGIKNDL